jgi:tetratricopeptide (TPR) repeat protein
MLQGRLQKIIEQTVVKESNNKTELDEETIARLEDLGYVSGGVKEDFSFDQSLNDPKDRLDYHLLNSRVMPMLGERKYDEAREISEKMISLYPELHHGYLNLGMIAMQKKEYAMAVKPLRKAIQCNPELYIAEGELGAALFEQKQFDESLLHLQESLRLNPRYRNSCIYLARHAWLRATSADDEHYDPPKALKLISQAMELTRENKKTAGMLRAMAAAYAANGNFSEALVTVRQAAKLAMTNGNKQLARELQTHIKSYKNNKPYREEKVAPQEPLMDQPKQKP